MSRFELLHHSTLKAQPFPLLKVYFAPDSEPKGRKRILQLQQSQAAVKESCCSHVFGAGDGASRPDQINVSFAVLPVLISDLHHQLHL